VQACICIETGKICGLWTPLRQSTREEKRNPMTSGGGSATVVASHSTLRSIECLRRTPVTPEQRIRGLCLVHVAVWKCAKRTSGLGRRLSTTNLLNRTMLPALNICRHYGSSNTEHVKQNHRWWRGWHAARENGHKPVSTWCPRQSDSGYPSSLERERNARLLHKSTRLRRDRSNGQIQTRNRCSRGETNRTLNRDFRCNA